MRFFHTLIVHFRQLRNRNYDNFVESQSFDDNILHSSTDSTEYVLLDREFEHNPEIKIETTYFNQLLT